MTPHRRNKLAHSLASIVCALVAISGCAGRGSPTASGSPSPRPEKPPADQSAFFAGPVDAYGQELTSRESDERAVARAVRRVDPCGFIDPDAAAQKIPGATSYGYGTSLGSCSIAQNLGAEQPPSNVRVNLTANSSLYDKSATKHTFQASGITITEASVDPFCVDAFSLDLAQLPGAPTDPEVIGDADTRYPLVVTSLRKGDPSCEQAKAVATSAARVRASGLPLRDAQSPVPVPLLANDPCSVFPDLTGFARYGDNSPDIFGCAFIPDGAPVATAVLSFNPIAAHYVKDAPATSTERRDGVTLYTGLQSPGCTVYAVAAPPLTPAPIGQKTADSKAAPLPDIEVRGPDCKQNKEVALAAAKKFAR